MTLDTDTVGMWRRVAVLWTLVGLLFGFVQVPVAASAADVSGSRPSLGWGTNTLTGVRETERALGMSPAVLSTYAEFDQEFPAVWAAEAADRGVPLVVGWEPWDWHRPKGPQPEFALARVAEGRFDGYVRQWARDARDSGVRVLVRFAPEMNGNWGSPWGAEYNTPADFVNAWRYLHRVFAEEGASNVEWVFNPNVSYWGEPYPLAAFWPGADVVDWVALDGYNWAGVLPGRPSETFDQVFAASIRELQALAPGLPLMIAETAAASPYKSAWVRSVVRSAPRYGVDLVVWFEHDKEADWMLSSLPHPKAVKPLMRVHGWRVIPLR